MGAALGFLQTLLILMGLGNQIQHGLNGLRAARLRLAGAVIGRDCKIAHGVQARKGFLNNHAGRIEVGDSCWLEDGVILDAFGGSITVGKSVFLGPYVVIYGHGGVTIGEHSSIAMHCRIVSSNHGVPAAGELIQNQADVLKPTVIGRDVWLGAGVTVLGGVVIGDGCVVGAGAVVTRDLPPGSICYGLPATVRGFREGASPNPA